MKKKPTLIRMLLLVVTLVALVGLPPFSTEARQAFAEESAVSWGATSPSINETHIFEGQINRKGDPVGYHSRPGGKDPASARVVAVNDPPNKAGVYTARVEIRKPNGPWLSKTSTFFPDGMSREDVNQAILHTYRNNTSSKPPKFSGPSGKGFTIEGYLLPDGRINTAFPVYRKDQ
jgi:hypothetical protein